MVEHVAPAKILLGFGPRLSRRERQVLLLLRHGLTNKEVAASLGLRVKTVDTYRTNLYRKLEVHNVAQLINASQRLNKFAIETE